MMMDYTDDDEDGYTLDNDSHDEQNSFSGIEENDDFQVNENEYDAQDENVQLSQSSDHIKTAMKTNARFNLLPQFAEVSRSLLTYHDSQKDYDLIDSDMDTPINEGDTYHKKATYIKQAGNYHSAQKKISLKTDADLKFESSQSLFIGHESIMTVVLKQCCSKNCLLSISPNRSNGDYSETYELVKACRLELMGLNEVQRMDEVRRIINGSLFCHYYNIIILLLLITENFILFIIESAKTYRNSTQAEGDYIQLIDYSIGSSAFKLGKKFNVCHRAFESVYQLTRYKRNKLLKDVKQGIKNSDNGFTDWAKVHDSTLQRIKTCLKSSDGGLGYLPKELITNMICPNSEKAFKVRVNLFCCY